MTLLSLIITHLSDYSEGCLDVVIMRMLVMMLEILMPTRVTLRCYYENPRNDDSAIDANTRHIALLL